MTVIDLGEVGSAPEHSPAGRGWRPRSGRRWAAAGVVLLCALVLGASGLPEAPTVRLMWEIGFSSDRQTTVRDDGVFVHQRNGIDTPELTAYDPETGAVRWRREFGDIPVYMPQGLEAGLLLLSADERYRDYELEDGSEGTLTYGGATIALDAATGAERWKAAGEVHTSTADTVLLGERTREGVLAAIKLVRAGDGGTVWQRPGAGADQMTIMQEAGRIVLADPAGRLTVLRYTDGTVVRQAPVPWTRPDLGRGVVSYLTLANGLLFVIRQQPVGSEIAAYRIDTLARRWRLDSASYAYPAECGPVICLSETTDTYGLDPATGRRLWSLPGFGSAYPVSDDRLLASTTGSDRSRQVLVDSRTGRQVGADAPGWPLRAEPGQQHLVLLNRYHTQNRSTSSVSRLDLATGHRVRIGAVTDVDAGQCTTARRHLICEVPDRLAAISVG